MTSGGPERGSPLARGSVVIGLLLATTVLPLTANSQEAASAAPAPSTAPPAQDTSRKLPADQLDALVAPVALYPDSLLAQVLAASTYPLELVQLQQWLKKNPKLKDKELADSVAKQPWDPSIQSLAGLPEVVNRLSDDVQWTTDLGNAFLAQQSDVMDAVQRMRKKAQDKGALKTDEHQKVETKVVESKTVVVIEQADPQVVYVPSYNPTVVYGPPVYAYPPIYYPPPGYYAAGMFMTFSIGVAMGAMWSGGWCCGASWGASNVQINNYNNFNRNTNVNPNTERNRTGGRDGGRDGGRGNDRGGGRSSNFQHNPQHRGGAPYGDRATADRFGGTARGDAAGSRQGGAQQLGTGQRASGSRGTGAAGTNARSTSAAAGGGRSSVSGGTGSRGAGGTSGGGGLGGGSSSAFGGGSRGYDGASARAASQRGASSFGGRSGGGGGGRARGGGGGRRR